MSQLSVIEGIIQSEILNIRTAFVAKVIRTGENTADIQPLQMFRQTDGTYEKNPILLGVPVLQHVCKFKEEIITDSQGGMHKQFKVIPVEVGDVVFGVCADRDLGYTTEGRFDKPTRSHNINDAVIVGVF